MTEHQEENFWPKNVARYIDFSGVKRAKYTLRYTRFQKTDHSNNLLKKGIKSRIKIKGSEINQMFLKKEKKMITGTS